MTRLIPAFVLLLAPLAQPALAAHRAETTVDLASALEGQVPAGARACLVEFGGRTPVATDCPLPCYGEGWDGPVLLAGNGCGTTMWVSYIFEAEFGRVFRTPCYELAAGETLAIPDPTIRPEQRRQVHVALGPSRGWPRQGFVPDCYRSRTAVRGPVRWLDDRQAASARRGSLGVQAAAGK